MSTETPPAAPFRSLCTDCGISRSSDPKRCGRACQFIAPDYDGLEQQVHGRKRDAGRVDELHFGPFNRMWRASLKTPLAGAQWTGITTRLGERLLESGKVDAVLAMSGDPDDRWRPVPVLVTRASDMKQCRGMRMGYAPLLSLLEPAAAQGIRRLAVIGIPCQVYALRALERELGFEKIYAIGTPCSDNTSTENFHAFLARLEDDPSRITYLEFRADYHVELRYDDGGTRTIPFLQLPLSDLPPDFFPLTCRTCVDYTNALSDITVGYMGGQGQQWLIVRNEHGEEILELLKDEVSLEAPQTAGKTTRARAWLHAEHPARRRWTAAAQNAELATAHRRLADAAHRSPGTGICPRPGGNEGNRNCDSLASRTTLPPALHGTTPHLASGRALWTAPARPRAGLRARVSIHKTVVRLPTFRNPFVSPPKRGSLAIARLRSCHHFLKKLSLISLVGLEENHGKFTGQGRG